MCLAIELETLDYMKKGINTSDLDPKNNFVSDKILIKRNKSWNDLETHLSHLKTISKKSVFGFNTKSRESCGSVYQEPLFMPLKTRRKWNFTPQASSQIDLICFTNFYSFSTTKQQILKMLF